MNHICFVVNKYPNKYEPYMLIFLQQLAWSMADRGIKVSVICPLPVNLNINYKNIIAKKKETTDNGANLDVYFPKTIGFGQSHYIFGKSPVGLTTHFMETAAEKIIWGFKKKPDVIYGHFLAPSGIVAARLGRKFDIPAFFAYGEAHDTVGQFGAENIKKELDSIAGVIAVSTYLKNDIVNRGIVSENRVEVFPNGVNSNRFFQHNKQVARQKFGFNKDDVIVAFVGSFNERKGVSRVCRAIEKVDGIKLICAGKGEQQPTGEKCIFAQAINPEDVPIFNSAADFFILPTLNEGCSNAVVEAMACGLPVISSNLPFNDDILDESCAIRIDPNDEIEIVKAIETLLKDTEMRLQISRSALEKAKSFTLEVRTSNIIDFIDVKIAERRKFNEGKSRNGGTRI